MNRSLIALLLFALFWTCLLFFSGTLTSGYHFVDDHEIITIKKDISDKGIIETSKSILKQDIIFRFRPFYYLHRILVTKILGTNFLAWSIYNDLLAIFTSYFLFLFCFRQGFRFINSLLFPFLTLIGTQAGIWWRLGPNETIGMFFLSASLVLLVKSVSSGKKIQLSFSIICLFISSLCKESFVIFIPAYIIILMWIKWLHLKAIKLSSILRISIVPIAFAIAILSAELAIIFFFTGTNGVGYAGIDNSFSISGYLNLIRANLRYSKYLYPIIFGMFLLVQNVKSWKIDLSTIYNQILPYIFNGLILMAIILPQYLLYEKSGIWERYLLPMNLGISLFIIFLSEKIAQSEITSIFTKRSYFFLIIMVVYLFLIHDTVPNAKLFADEGKSANKFLSSIILNSKPNDSIMIVLNGFDNYESGFSVVDYLRIKGERNKISFYTANRQLPDSMTTGMNRRFLEYFRPIIVKKITNNYSCIGVFQFTGNNIIKNEIDSNRVYQRNDFDNYTVYLKKEIKDRVNH